MGLFGGSSDGGAAAQEAARQANITQGMANIDQQFSQFDDKFYKAAGDKYTAAAMPKLQTDYTTTRNNLTYALARAGLMKSGAAVAKNTSLQNTLSENESTVANNAQNASNTLRADVNTQKGTLVNQLQASADPASIASQATAATSQLRGASPIQPLGNLFADWSQQYLSTQTGNSGGGSNVWQQLANSKVGQASPSGGSSFYVP